MRRTPCPGCGSRFHRDCSQPRTGKGKGSRKGKGKSKGAHPFFGALAAGMVFALSAARATGQA